MRKQFAAPDDPLQGVGLGEEGSRRLGRQHQGLRQGPPRAMPARESAQTGERHVVDAIIPSESVGAVGPRRSLRRRPTSSHDRPSRQPLPTEAATCRPPPTGSRCREAAEILAAANIHFRPETIGGWARTGRLSSIKLGGRRYVRRGEVRALVAAPRRVRAEDIQPGLFEELDGLI